jgi:hypothetical protein
MSMKKDRKSHQSGHSHELGRGIRQQRMWSPSHKTGRGGGNRK